MVQFKKLICEVNETKFLSKLESEFRVYHKPLYRGTKRKIETYGVFSPRKDRDPLTTDQMVQDFVSVVNDAFYPSHPNRERSKFATAFKKEADEYHDYTYYFFPHKNAKVSWYESDTYYYHFSSMEGIKGVRDNLIGIKKEEVEGLKEYDKKIYNIILGFWNYVSKDEKKTLLEAFERYDTIEQLNSDLKEYKSLSGFPSFARNICYTIRKYLKHAIDYFESAKNRFIAGDSEIVVEGEYLQANIDWVVDEIGKEKIWGEERFGGIVNQER